MKIKKAIIPAAGLGVRFLPATKAQPKEMLPIVDKPTIQYIVEEAVASGIEDILIVTGKNKRAIEDHFDKSPELEMYLEKRGKEDLLEIVRSIGNMVDIHYVRQKEPLGLGHAIYCARKFIGNEPFAVLLGDDLMKARTPVLKQMIDLYEKVEASIVAVQAVEPREVSKYGIIKAEEVGERLYRVYDLVEKPKPEEAPSNLAVMGRYIIEPEIFEFLEKTPPGAGGEIQLTDALRMLCQVKPIYGYVYEGLRYDVGDKLGFLKATVEFALDREELAQGFKAYLKELVEKEIK
ncbi:UTP--glucose-1-phosphate uridylyltransferase GalU [Carboxydothermus hydrogenoformans]|uniref:UTP--glucose-1-phosphate uridylyltransferase n=1 Tax=Carboxydothermus hydrogenoformans (strain ATCC BAA-161 / DSM 6008 / Z-2901) TaxID=246194 RepID=Q3A909_CARHZ|nr:UTP--glucose-1-phosphate uridylyltransferase GalU [Carboxydothermus hydrogenoformans]ABB14042.1 UTP-glucose-1-phosphate uridylyltransferase [Carboxydothermus hydrogenoformans Z-2901]